MDTEWEGSGELCPAFDIPVTRLFADIVSEDSVAPRDPELRLQHVEIFNFGVNDNSAILASDSDTDSTVYEYEAEPVTEEPVVVIQFYDVETPSKASTAVPESLIPGQSCLPWEHLCVLDDGEMARVTEADWGSGRP
eukprot:gene535-926_t